MRLPRGTGFTLAALAFSVAFLLPTLGLSPAARRVALPTALLVTVLLAVQLVREAREAREARKTRDVRAPPDAEVDESGEAGSETGVGGRGSRISIAWVLALPALIAIAGLCGGVGLHAFAFLRVRGKESLPVAAIGALALTGLVWWVVGTLLGAEIPGGLIAMVFGAG